MEWEDRRETVCMWEREREREREREWEGKWELEKLQVWKLEKRKWENIKKIGSMGNVKGM